MLQFVITFYNYSPLHSLSACSKFTKKTFERKKMKILLTKIIREQSWKYHLPSLTVLNKLTRICLGWLRLLSVNELQYNLDNTAHLRFWHFCEFCQAVTLVYVFELERIIPLVFKSSHDLVAHPFNLMYDVTFIGNIWIQNIFWNKRRNRDCWKNYSWSISSRKILIHFKLPKDIIFRLTTVNS